MNEDLIREEILTHSRSNQNGLFPTAATLSARMTNPLCGDHVELRIHTQDQIILNIGFKAKACAICSASASMVSQELKGQSIKLALQLAESFEQTLIGPHHDPWPGLLENFRCFEHVKVTPSRKMCALLPWIVLKKAMA